MRRVELLSQVVSAESRSSRLARALVFPLALKLPFMRALMLATVTGLDHELPHILPMARAEPGLATAKAG